jgi:hypothetical protein
MDACYGPRYLADKRDDASDTAPIAVYFSDEGGKMANGYRIPAEIIVDFGGHRTRWSEFIEPEGLPEVGDLADGILGFALTNNPPHNERDRVGAYQSEMRALGVLLADATDEQLAALMPNMDLAMVDRGVDPREMPMVLADLRKKLDRI